jgi:hypothetical protein
MRPLVAALCLALAACAPVFAQAPAPDYPDLADRLAKAPVLEAEDLGEPVRTIRLGMTLTAPNPDGRTWDIVQIYFPKYGGPNTIALIDTATGGVRTMQTERGYNFHLCPSVIAPGGILFISILDGRLRQQICVYDPATNELALNALKMPEDLRGETHPLVIGTNGRLYAIGADGTKAAAAAEIDPATGAVAFFPAIGPSHAPSECWGYSGAADDRYIYIASGKVPWRLVACDRQTGKSETLLETGAVGGYIGVSQGRYGCTATATGLKDGPKGQRTEYWLHGGKAVLKKDKSEKPPWTEPADPRPHVALPPQPDIALALAVPDAEGKAEIWVRTAEARAAAPKDAAADAPLDAIGYKPYRFQTPLHAQDVYRLLELPDGRLMGTAGAYEGNFLVDPATGRTQHPGKIELSHYSTAIVDGRVYMSGYPSSGLYVYDPSRPWTAGKPRSGGRVVADDAPDANPRRLAYLNKWAGTHKMYAAAVGADGRAYFGGQWMRDGSAGGLAWWDPKTGEGGGFWEDLSNYQVTHMAAAAGGRLIAVSTRRIEDTLLGKPKPEGGRLFVFDTTAGRLVRHIDPVATAKGSGVIAAAGGTRVLGWTENPDDPKSSFLYLADLEAGKVLWRRTLPAALPVAIGSNQMEPFDFRPGPDGRVWTFIDSRLVRIAPGDGAVEVLGRLPRGGPVAFVGGDVYLGGQAALRRIKGMAK